LAGSQGVAGVKGDSGTPGVKGDTGSTGPSQMTFGTINFSHTVSGGLGTSISSIGFGTFTAGKSYFVHLILVGLLASGEIAVISSTTQATGGSPTITAMQVISNGTSQNQVTATPEMDTTIDVYLLVNGSSVVTNFSFISTVTCWNYTGSNPLTLQGTYIAQLIGAIV
jgi:hypothetical protein